MTAADHASAPPFTPPTRAAEYAAAVRRHLGHLTPEQREELTDGLEADLAEALDDHGAAANTGADADAADGSGPAPEPSAVDLTAVFGDPAAYADELCQAAGLAPRGARPRRATLRSLALVPWTTLQAQLGEGLTELRGTSWWPGIEAFLVSLRPFGWVVRGWTVVAVLGAMWRSEFLVLPANPIQGALFVLAIVVSVQWGRDRWLRSGRGLRTARTVASAVAVIAFVPVFATLLSSQGATYYNAGPEPAYIEAYPENGVWVDSEQVTNLFAYDADGVLIERFQLVDQRGRPVLLVTSDRDGEYEPADEENSEYLLPVASVDQYGEVRRNVYPRSGARWEHLTWAGSSGRWIVDGAANLVAPKPPLLALAPALAPGLEAGGAATDDEADTGEDDGVVHDDDVDPDDAVSTSPSPSPSSSPSQSVSSQPSPSPSATK